MEDHQFFEEAQEIDFFKNIKPALSCHGIFWQDIFEFELGRPAGGRQATEQYIDLHFQKINQFYEAHKTFHFYYRSGSTNLDRQYFTRYKELLLPHGFPCIDLDRKFSTGYDWLVAAILANDMFNRYLQRELQGVQSLISVPPLQVAQSRGLHWTQSKASLVELIYALQSGAAFNSGKADIKQIAGCFEKLFDVELGNFFNTFQEIRLRKKNRTSFLDNIREKLLQRMDEADVR